MNPTERIWNPTVLLNHVHEPHSSSSVCVGRKILIRRGIVSVTCSIGEISEDRTDNGNIYTPVSTFLKMLQFKSSLNSIIHINILKSS